ncbi:sensor histidine kinase [Streptomyces massasporeus]|uniref:sensor histidine kinase n=1 Tax=Streptomyces massasporeus TaxID=67324 RepID=UPI00367EA927
MITNDSPQRETSTTTAFHAEATSDTGTQLSRTMHDSAWQALRHQSIFRLAIVGVVSVMNITTFPPAENAPACYAIMALYAAMNIAILPLHPLRNLFILSCVMSITDVVAVTSVLWIAGGFPGPLSPYLPLFDDLYFLIPIVAAFQVYPGITAGAGVASAVGYALGASLSDPRPSAPYIFAHVVFISLAASCAVAASRIYHSRADTIGRLVVTRSVLLAQTMTAEERERQVISETLHDGALQNILAARQDVQEALESRADSREQLTRAEMALTDAAKQLRYSVGELRPELLSTQGLEAALHHVAITAAERGNFELEYSARQPFETDVDQIIFRAASEMLSNIVRHAQARHVIVHLDVDAVRTWLLIEDDGLGISPGAGEKARRSGHIGLASHQVRIEGAGGTMAVTSRDPQGTRVVMQIPTRRTDHEH